MRLFYFPVQKGEQVKHKILVVDDEVALTKMIKLNLERTEKLDVRIENNGIRAFEAVKSFQPDLIFLDIMMPDISGDDVAQQLRQDNKLAHIPIVFLTAIVSKDETETMGSVVGGNRFLAKPVKTEEILEVIEEILG